MKGSYREGVADHPGPEPCEGGRKAALEALDRGIRRLAQSAALRFSGTLPPHARLQTPCRTRPVAVYHFQ
jgi:hypothetical protein